MRAFHCFGKVLAKLKEASCFMWLEMLLSSCRLVRLRWESASLSRVTFAEIVPVHSEAPRGVVTPPSADVRIK